MRVLVFSDIHSDLTALRRLIATEADYYIAAGDLVSWGKGLDRCGEILRTRGEQVWVLPGNHESAEQIASFCEKFGLRNFHEQLIEVAGRRFGGLGYSSPTPFSTPGEYTEEELERRLLPFSNVEGLIMVCHAPPYGTDLDQIRPGVHGGSRAVRAFIEATHPEYFFCGHIHEAEGKEIRTGKTVAVNVGKRGYLLEL
jgi:Icc-related predicted phosphoesterase